MVGNMKHYNGRAIREQTIVNSLFCMCYREEYTLLFTHRSSLFNAGCEASVLVVIVTNIEIS